MELFRPAGICRTDPDSRDWTREHGYAKASAFPFPDLYLDDKVAQLTREDPAVLPFLQQCLRQFVNHEYGHLSSLDLVENFLNRDVHQKNTWMRGNYPSPAWGEIRLEIFYDMGLFHLEDVPPRALALEQSRKEAAHTADLHETRSACSKIIPSRTPWLSGSCCGGEGSVRSWPSPRKTPSSSCFAT
ncbi:MAG: hypothetical protein ACLUHN_01855 [Evtepia gabavorous]